MALCLSSFNLLPSLPLLPFCTLPFLLLHFPSHDLLSFLFTPAGRPGRGCGLIAPCGAYPSARGVWRDSQSLLGNATVTTINRTAAPSGSVVAPSGRRGPRY